MNRILIEPHEHDATGRVVLTDWRADHICGVLRAQEGQVLRIGQVDGPCGTGTVERMDAEGVCLRLELEVAVPRRPAVDLLLALPRPKVLKRLWAQLAALGIGRIMLTNAAKVERCYFDSHVLEIGFYRRQLLEGLQQAGDTRVPQVFIRRQLKPFLEDELEQIAPDTLRVLADPSGERSLADVLGASSLTGRARLLLAVGPEGGWTPYERELFASHGFRTAGMGSRILRTDTACIALLALAHQALDAATPA